MPSNAQAGTQPRISPDAAPSRMPARLARTLALPTLAFWGLAAVTGALSGFGAVGLEKLLKAVERQFWPEAATFLGAVEVTTGAHRVGVLVMAGLIFSVATLLARGPLGGHGTAQIIESIWYKAGQLPFVKLLSRGALSIVGVGMGISLGREGALIQAGAAAGSEIGRRLHLSATRVRQLVACGAAAGIAAAYNVPIGAAVFGLEVLLGSFALELLGPIVVSCVMATVVSRTLLSAHPSYVIPHYAMLNVSELAWALALGPIVGAASALFTRTVDVLPRLVERVPRRWLPALPTVAAAVTGAVAIAFPQVLGNGYDATNAALHGTLPLTLLLVLPVLKLAVTALCSAFGIPGGLFTPSLFFGGLVGGAVGVIANQLAPGSVPPGALALLGMAGSLAGTTHAAASAVLIIFELTGDYSIVLPLMLTSVFAAGFSRQLAPYSLYTSVLHRRSVPIPQSPRPAWLHAVDVRSLVEPAVTISPLMPFRDVVVQLLTAKDSELFVTDEGGRFLGMISLDAVKQHVTEGEDLAMVVAADVMDRGTTPLSFELSLSDVAVRFGSSELRRLPVIDRATGKFLGAVPRRELFRRTNQLV